MEDVLIALMGLAALVMVLGFWVYDRYDRLRFRIERLLKVCKPELDDWARACGALVPGSDTAYFQAKKPVERMACLRQMVEAVEPDSEEKLDLQEALLESCYALNQMTEQFDRKLERPVLGPLARKLGFRSFGRLDFYPGISAAPGARGEK